ncbi:MAG TPA: DUF2817 domain-containing protein, partial [Acidiphilium sp.]
MTDALRSQFSTCYAEARTKLLASAEAANATVESHVLDTHTGALGETLATDTVLIAPEGAENLLVITSGTHGVEGFPGSGCQIGLLRDANMLGIAKANRVAILLIHAVNPHGFSHIRRTNEDNIDINRNCVDFAHPLPANADYREVHDLLVPKAWPPTGANERALDAWRETNGAERLRTALTIGQYHTPNGLFYGGTAPSWSHRTLRAILKRHLPEYRGIGLIDFHTGLGPSGHGEKIFIGGPDAAMEQPRARAIWGSDIVPIGTTGAASVTVSGPIVRLVYEEAA